MKKALCLCVCLLLCACLCACGQEKKQDTGNKIFGSFTALDIDGTPTDQTIFADTKVTMVNMWATFCGPCIKEMPDIAELNKEYNSTDFKVVGIITDAADRNFANIPANVQKARQIIEQTGADYTHLIPSKSLNDAHLAMVQAVPETVFVDSTGKQIGKTYVGSKSKQEWKEIIDKLLERYK